MLQEQRDQDECRDNAAADQRMSAQQRDKPAEQQESDRLLRAENQAREDKDEDRDLHGEGERHQCHEGDDDLRQR